MKKNRIYGLMKNIGLFKMMKIMRFTVFILIISLTQVIAGNSYSQQTKLFLNMKNVKVEDVLDEIEKSSEFFFLYNKNMVNVDRIVAINADGKLVTEVLDQLFKNTDVTYSIRDRQILLINNRMLESSVGTVSQQKGVTGKVTDKSGLPLPGVSVFIQGTNNGTITDANGAYTLSNISSEKKVPLTTDTVNSKKPAHIPWNISFSKLSNGGRKDTIGEKRCWCRWRSSHKISTANSAVIPNNP